MHRITPVKIVILIVMLVWGVIKVGFMAFDGKFDLDYESNFLEHEAEFVDLENYVNTIFTQRNLYTLYVKVNGRAWYDFYNRSIYTIVYDSINNSSINCIKKIVDLVKFSPKTGHKNKVYIC